MNKNQPISKFEEIPPAMPLPVFLLTLVAAAGGALAATLILPTWLPGMETSMAGSEPQAFWFLSRSSALVAYLLLWLSMCLGLLITNKLARLWPGGPVAFDLHQHASLLGVAFALFHGLILLGDHYLNPSMWQVVFPFGMLDYQPFWVGLGQIGFYLMAIVAFSFYVRKQITPRIWRSVHFVSFVSFVFALLHGIASGTDSTAAWVQSLYWGTGGIFLFLFIYRILVTVIKPVSVRQTS
jgi:predicted ferric reductase